MHKDAKKTPKGSRTKMAAVKDLTVKDAKAVKGGKAGKGQQEYLIIKMNDVLITSVNPSGSGDGN